MIKKIYVFPQTTVNKQFVIAKCLCLSNNERDTSYEGGGSGPGMGEGGGEGEGNFTKERNSREYGNIW